MGTAEARALGFWPASFFFSEHAATGADVGAGRAAPILKAVPPMPAPMQAGWTHGCLCLPSATSSGAGWGPSWVREGEGCCGARTALLVLGAAIGASQPARARNPRDPLPSSSPCHCYACTTAHTHLACAGILAVSAMNQWLTPEIDIAFVVGSFGASGERAQLQLQQRRLPCHACLQVSA